MGDYLRIARAYLRRTTLAVWCFFFLCLLMVSADVGDTIARNQGGVLGGVLSRKSYLAMFAYFNACLLGVLLRDNIAHTWASVLPHYRQKHLLVTALIALFFLGIPMFSMEFVGTSDIATLSVAVIFLTCLAAGLWTLHHPALGVLAVPFLVFAMAPSSSSPGLAAFLAGTHPAASAALVFISLLALWVLAWRLLALNEDRVAEYSLARLWGGFLRGRGVQTFPGQFGHPGAEGINAPAFSALQNFDLKKTPFTNLQQLDNLSGYSERSLWQRLQLWRLGTAPTRTFTSVGYLMVITFIMMPLLTSWPEFPAGAGGIVVIFSVQIMVNPFNMGIWPSWFQRRYRLGYESLRPRTRQQFVRELGLAFLWDIVGCWLGGFLFMGITAAIWAPELLQVKNIILFILCTGASQLCVYSMGIWFLKRGMIAFVCCELCAFVAIGNWIVWTMNGHIGVEFSVTIASVLAAASVGIIALAYRRWCRADLD